MTQFGINPNWTRWIWASATKWWDDHKGDLPIFFEGDDRDTADLQDYIEFRMDGPKFVEFTADSYEVRVQINILVASVMNSKTTHRFQQTMGLVQSMFSKTIPVFKYGDMPQDNPSELIGCLQIQMNGRNSEKLSVNQFGQIEKTFRMQQATIEAEYRMDIQALPPLNAYLFVMADSLAMADAATHAIGLEVSSDLGLFDNLDFRISRNVFGVDSLTLADFAGFSQVFFASNDLALSDTVTVTFTRTEILSDPLSITDTVVELLTHQNITLLSTSSSLSLTDAAVAQGIHINAVSSSLTLTDTGVGEKIFQPSVASVLSMADSESLVFAHGGAASSALVLVDSVIVHKVSSPHVSDPMSVTDAIIHSQKVSSQTVSNLLAMSDQLDFDRSIQVQSISSALTLTDVVIGGTSSTFHVYYSLVDINGTDRHIRRVDPSGANDILLCTLTNNEVNQMSVDVSHSLLWIGCSSGDIFKVAITGGTPISIKTDVAGIDSLKYNPTNNNIIYSIGKTIKSIAVTGGSPTTLDTITAAATFQLMIDVAAGEIYYFDGRIMKGMTLAGASKVTKFTISGTNDIGWADIIPGTKFLISTFSTKILTTSASLTSGTLSTILTNSFGAPEYPSWSTTDSLVYVLNPTATGAKVTKMTSTGASAVDVIDFGLQIASTMTVG